MKLLSIRQPWAHLIIRGIKDVENRSWSRHYRGPMLIHAGQACGSDEREFITEALDDGDLKPSETLFFGGIIGIVELVDIVDNSRSKWAYDGEQHWLLKRPRRLPFVRMKAFVGLLDVKWPQEPSGPRVSAACAHRARDLALEDETPEPAAILLVHVDVDDTDAVMAAIASEIRKHGGLARETMVARLAAMLGFGRVSAERRAAIDRLLRTAARRGIIRSGRDGNFSAGGP